ncbi:MAG: hypothetical protein PVS3B3_20090 [Ktedonobacteraceae bacterium]
MPQFRSLPTVERNVAYAKEGSEAYFASQTPITSSFVPVQYMEQPHISTDELSPVSQPLHDIPTTQSLINALQATTFTPRRTDKLIVIPGSNKGTRLLPEAHGTQMPVRRMRRRTRHGIALGTVLFVLLFTMLTLAPLDGGQSTFHIFSGVVKWANIQQQDWNILAHTDTTNASTTVPPITTVAGNAPPITLPTSQYVAIARQDAINAGIPPDYFVRQIYAESGFNPNASSPAGAVGIAQFEPGTAAGLGINPYDPVQALSGAARLMASYAIQYNGDYAKALAAYNAGGGNLDYAVRTCGANWLHCVPAETQNYIFKIMGI